MGTLLLQLGDRRPLSDDQLEPDCGWVGVQGEVKNVQFVRGHTFFDTQTVLLTDTSLQDLW